MITPVSSAGKICFYVYGTAHLLADVSGYVPTGSDFVSLTPARLVNTAAVRRSATLSAPGLSWKCRCSVGPVCPARPLVCR